MYVLDTWYSFAVRCQLHPVYSIRYTLYKIQGCGALSQTMLHLLYCPPLSSKICSKSDLCAAIGDAVEVVKFWANKI